MTTEEKAKAYDKALNWMRELYPGLHGATKEDAEQYFPELRESEDERIRKGLIEVVSDIAGSWPFEEHKITKKEALAYLEKQKEYKPTSFNEPYNPDDYEVVMEGNATSLKRKERKPIEDVVKDITKNKESAIKFLKSAGIMDDNGELAEIYRSEQKPEEWSEEDERHLIWLCRIIHNRVVNKELSLAEESELGKWIDKWINHKPQPVQKWDDFDEDCLKRAIWYVENPAPSVVKDTNLVLWLKSLRPQPHWKPSEEQMKHLERCFSHGHTSQLPNQHILESLYNELKKLT